MKFIFNEVHHEVELYLKHAQQSRENEGDEVIAETFVEDEYSIQAAGLLCAALVYSLNLNQICLAIGNHYIHFTGTFASVLFNPCERESLQVAELTY